MARHLHRGSFAALACAFLAVPVFASPRPGADEPLVAAGSSNVPRLVEDHFVETVADSSGPVEVSVVDGIGFEQGEHGQRVRDNFLANTKRSRLVQIEGWGTYRLGGRTLTGMNPNGFIRHVLSRGGGIFFTSTDLSHQYSESNARNWFFERGRPFHKDARIFAEWMQDQDTLFISSLENPTGLGLGKGGVYCDEFALDAEGTWIPLCGVLDDYIAHSGVGLEKALFVGAIDRYGAAAAIRGDGVFAPHAIYVESTNGSTSQATPVLAAYATNLAFSNPGWDAARLKRELMGIAVEEVVDHATGGSNERGQGITERRVVRVIRPAFAPKGEPPEPCVEDAETLCLLNARYSVALEWRKTDGQIGAGRAVQGGTDDSGLFTFFDPDNWEVLIKVLDGCSVNGNVWVYGASTTDLGYTIKVTDTETASVRRYSNEAGRPAQAITDAKAFPGGC